MTDARSRCGECPTRRFCLARDLDASGLDRLSALLAPPIQLSRGDYLYRFGDRTSALHLVRSGAFKTLTVTADGEEHVTGFHFPGEIFGLTGFTTGVHEDTAMALDTSSVCRVHVDELPGLWGAGCDVAFLRLLGEKESAATRLRILLSEPRAASRLAVFLLQLAERQRRLGRTTDVLYLPVSRTDLANHLGMTLEALSRVISRLSRAGLLAMERMEVRVLRQAELETLAGSR
ncbi:MAG: cyclic nucleotide-binding domain-containing protein [Pseudomonadales bacterium]